MKWKEYKKLWKDKRLYTQQGRITKEGIHFSETDFLDFVKYVEKEVKEEIKRLAGEFRL